MPRGVFPVLALAAALLLAGCGESRLERTDKSWNQSIINSLSVFPGAVETHESTTPYGHGIPGDRHPVGYSTTVVYRVSRGTSSAAVLRFYVRRLNHWRGWIGSRSRHRPFAVFGRPRDRSAIHVTAYSLAPGRQPRADSTYEINVAYRGDCCRH
jgi:hypothetical protein